MIEKLSDSEFLIYNEYLKASRNAQGKPFRPRKNFEDLSGEKVEDLLKLGRFFQEFPTVSMGVYFSAPYFVFPDGGPYSLNYFTTQAAKKAYASHLRSLELEDPDSQEMLSRLAESLKFVVAFCKENDLTLSQYETFLLGSLPAWVTHLKHHRINYHTLHSLSIKVNTDKRTLDFIFGDFFQVFETTKRKFFHSKLMKKFATQVTKKLTTKHN